MGPFKNTVGFIISLLLISNVQCIDEACSRSVQECAMAFQMGVARVGNDIVAMCEHVNSFLECTNEKLQPCDLDTKTSLLTSMVSLVDTYNRHPYNCSLEFAKNFTVPECSLQIGECANYNLQAETYTNNPAEGCRLHQIYKSCLNVNTTSCSGVERDQINETLNNATDTFSLCPFNCYGENVCLTTTTPMPTTMWVYVSTDAPESNATDSNATYPQGSDATDMPDINYTTDSVMYGDNSTDDVTVASGVVTSDYNNNDTTTLPGNDSATSRPNTDTVVSTDPSGRQDTTSTDIGGLTNTLPTDAVARTTLSNLDGSTDSDNVNMTRTTSSNLDGSTDSDNVNMTRTTSSDLVEYNGTTDDVIHVSRITSSGSTDTTNDVHVASSTASNPDGSTALTPKTTDNDIQETTAELSVTGVTDTPGQKSTKAPVSITSKPITSKPAVTDKPSDVQTTSNKYPYKTDSTMTFNTTQSAGPTSTKNWDSLGNNDASVVAVSGVIVTLFSLISSLIN